MLETGYGCVPDAWREILEVSITAEELKAAVFKGDSKKSPHRDGIGLEFFKVLWEDIAGDMRTLFTQTLRDYLRNYHGVRNKESYFASRKTRGLIHQRIIGR